MQINGVHQLHGVQGVNAPQSARPMAEAQPTSSPINDQVDISEAGRLMEQLSQIPDVRADRVSALRAAIAEGNYDTDAKMSVALDRLLDEIG